MDGKTLALLFALAAAPVGLGCVKNAYHVERCDRPDPSGCVIERVTIKGNRAVSSSQIKEKIATAESSHVLGGVFERVPLLSIWDRLTVEYERLDPFVLQRDLARVERLYRARGYYEAHVQAGRVVKRPDGKISVEIAVDEGDPVRIGKVDLDWTGLTPDVPARATNGVKDIVASFEQGEIFEEDPFEAAKGKILRVLTDRGFAYAKVVGKADVDLTRHEAHLRFAVDLGPRCKFGPITLEGQGDLPTVPLLATLRIREGGWFSTSAIDSAEVALGDYGIFGSIDAVPKLSAPGEPPNPVIPVVFRVQRAPLHAAKLGVGGEIGGHVEVHGIAGWENRNFFGGLRRFSVELSPAFVFFPLTFSTLADGYPVTVLPQARLRVSLTQPGILLPFDARTRGVFRGSVNIYQLDTTIPQFDSADAVRRFPIVGYVEGAASAGLERPFWSSHINTLFSLNFQADAPFEYHLTNQKPLPPEYSFVFIPVVQASGSIDFRSSDKKRIDPVNPHRGVYFNNDFQFAFGTARDIRLRPELRGYVPLTSRMTLALKFGVGLLFPFNYGSGASGEDPSQACRDSQILPFRAFFSGGSSSNRGYPYNGVGPHEVTCLSKINFMPTPTNPSPTPVATGGDRLWESSIELRIPVYGSLGTVLFADASDVTRKAFRICAPHLSAGLGLRYDTPVGPLRADLGWRVPGAQFIQNTGACSVANQREEGTLPTVLKLPIAVQVAIGEAF